MGQALARSFLRRQVALVSMMALLVFLAGWGLAPAISAQELSQQPGGAVPPAAVASPAEDAGRCEAASSPFVTTTAFCWYCDADYCGCLTREDCILYYSCSCSSIDCRRSCSYGYCTE